jgi:MFS family permease
MTPTSLAMSDHGFSAVQAADVVRWHVFAMYAPSFFTGSLIGRFGHLRIIATGLVLLVCCAAIALMGVDIHHFYIALIFLGVGWNFGFIGATSLLATMHSADEQVFIRGLNDFLVFGCVAVASFGSGALLNGWGWAAVQYAAAPAVVVALGVLVWCATRREKLGKLGSDPISR